MARPERGPGTVAVVGAGWAGLACAVTLVEAGCRVTVFEAGKVAGGRARTVAGSGAAPATVDNGQHLLIGPYRATFALMDRIGVDRQRMLRRLPLALQGSDGLHLHVPPWPLGLGVLAALAGARGLGPGGRLALLRLAWAVPALLRATAAGAADVTASEWLRASGQPAELVRRLWAPLCVAALNTPAERASAQVFAQVLQDGLLAAGSAASLELPARPLGELLPEPALAWLRAHGAELRLGCRVASLARATAAEAVSAGDWRLDTTRGPAGPFDAVVVAVAPHQAAALIAPHADTDTLATLRGLEYEAIATVHLRLAAALPDAHPPLLLLHDGPGEWLVDHGHGRLSVVMSAWQRHEDEPGAAVAAQLRRLFPGLPPILASRTLVEKRATFACTPDLARPGHAGGACGLWLAGDYTAGPYPATLESAVRSGVECGRLAADRR
jgi:squalene-associated FAD-dependent desaturase